MIVVVTGSLRNSRSEPRSGSWAGNTATR